MAKYIETAKEANKDARLLFDMVPDDMKPDAAVLIARMVNWGMRCCPRPAQSTVRLNAVRESVRGLPVQVTMTQVADERTGKTYNALGTTPVTT